MFFDETVVVIIRTKWGMGEKNCPPPPLPPGLAYKDFKHGSPHVSAHLWAILRGEEYFDIHVDLTSIFSHFQILYRDTKSLKII